MSKILEMIKNEKVEWKKLGDICDDKFWIMPSTPKFISSGIPYITGKNIRNGLIDFENVKFISQNDYMSINKNREIRINDILISMIGTIGEIGIVNDDKKFYGQNLYLVRLNKNIIINRYFFHFFTQSSVKDNLISKKNSSSQGYIRAGQLNNLEIPVPSLETQEKIVEILDKFVKYSSELQTELQNRSSQYEYFRDLVLSKDYLIKLSMNPKINQKLKKFKIGDLFNTRNGYTPSKSKKEFWDKKEIPWFKMEDIRENGNILSSAKTFASKLAIKGKAFEKNSIILATSATIGEHALITVPFLANQRFTCFTLKEDLKNEINMKFMYYYFYIIDKWCINNIKIGNFPSVEVKRLLNQKISIPNIEIQNKIVEVLDKFQNLISDDEGLLPEEILQRQKQYEYYREKLLTFENNMVQVKSSQVK